jgi:hypothetical protein
VLFLQVAIRRPTIQIVRSWSLANVVFRVIYTVQFRLLAGMYLISLPARRDFAFSTNHRDARSVAILVDIHPKCSRLLYCKRDVRRVDFVEIAFPQFAHAKVQRAFRNPRLEDVFVQIQEGERSHASQVQRRLACLQLRA